MITVAILLLFFAPVLLALPGALRQGRQQRRAHQAAQDRIWDTRMAATRRDSPPATGNASGDIPCMTI
jgi:hypothetical protein